MGRRWALLGVMGAALALAGCADTYGYGNYYARTPPPPSRYERYGEAPGPVCLDKRMLGLPRE